MTAGLALAQTFNRAFRRTRLNSATLDRWMAARGVPDAVIDITAMAYASAAIQTFTAAADPVFDEPACGWCGVVEADGQRAILIPEGGLVKSQAAKPPETIMGPFGPCVVPQAEAPLYCDIADIVAFDPDDARRWWTMRAAIQVLGEDVLTSARDAAAPVTLYRDPLSWLKAGRAGCVLIDRAADPRRVFHGVPEIVCEDDAHAAWLRDRMRKFALRGMPKVGTAQPQDAGSSSAQRRGSPSQMTPEPARAA